MDGVEFYGGLAFLKAGLFYADRLTTVSPTYAREIQTPAFGMGPRRAAAHAAPVMLTGILNGVDPAVWAPEDDAALPVPYSADDVAGKAAAKAALAAPLRSRSRTAGRRRCSASVTRLTPQKGLDLLLAALPGLVALGGQSGAAGQRRCRDLEAGFRAAARTYPGQVGVEIGYDEALSHLIIGRQRQSSSCRRASSRAG